MPQSPLQTFATPLPASIAAENAYSFANFNAATAGTQIKTGSGVLGGLNVNTLEASSSITLYDGTNTSGKKIGTFATTAAGNVVLPVGGVAFLTGLFAVVVSTPDVTVFYK